MESAPDEPARIRALGRNHDLWSLLLKDLALEGNRLPEAIRSNLVTLGLWAMRYSTLAILKNLSADPLIEVNRNIAEGLKLQAELHKQPPTNGKLETAPA